MIKNKLKIILVISLLGMLILHISYSYATGKVNNIKEMKFFEVEKNEVAIGEKIKMTINIDKVKYEKFEFKLQSDCNISNLEINEKDVSIKKENNEIIMNIDKNDSNIKTIDLYYGVPEKLQINDTIKFKATVTSLDENKNTDQQNKIENNESTDAEKKSETIEIEVKITEKNSDEKKDDNKKNDELEDKKNEEKRVEPSTSNNKEKMPEQTSIEKNSKTNSSISNLSKEKSFGVLEKSITAENIESEIVTYNGSCNNYLKELAIENYSLNKEFTKENSTYFVTVSDDITSLNITANAEEDIATVCIYGNEQLNKGTNKILISVTAENGNIRKYRIYVTKN